jgi:hypothetical protein
MVGFCTFVTACGQSKKKEGIESASKQSEVKQAPQQNKTDFHEGDIVFQTSLSAQSKAIQMATHSRYSHCGILFKDKSGWFVLEAVQPVKKTSLDTWIAKGEGGAYEIRRLKMPIRC